MATRTILVELTTDSEHSEVEKILREEVGQFDNLSPTNTSTDTFTFQKRGDIELLLEACSSLREREEVSSVSVGVED